MRTASWREARLDAALLAGVQMLMVAGYITRLGFSSDDWSFLGYMHTAPGDSLPELYRAVESPFHAMRPVFIAMLALLYQAFGLQPLGYHVVNACMLWLAALGLYAVGRRFVPRRLALAVALVFLVLPEYSTIRFWVTALPLTLSLALFVASLYADLRAVERPVGLHGGWKLAALLSMAAGNLAYELFLPLVLANVVLAEMLLRRRERTARPSAAARLVFHGSTIAVAAGIAAFKLLTTVRLGHADLLARYDHFRHLLSVSARIAVFDYGLGLPKRVARLASAGSLLWPVLSAGAVGLLVALRLHRLGRGEPSDASDGRRALGLVAVGVLVFVGGYAIFLTNSNAMPTPTGIGNRIAIAASIGIALAIVGAIDFLAGGLRAPHPRSIAFATALGAVCACSVFVVQGLAGFWTESWRRQVQITRTIRHHWPTTPPGTTLILDGVCPYVGPAVVFESNWDLRGWLMTSYRDTSLKADVASAHLSVEDGGLRTVLYGSIVADHPWGPGLQMFDVRDGSIVPLPDRAAALRYFAAHSRPACPPAVEGLGAAVF